MSIKSLFAPFASSRVRRRATRRAPNLFPSLESLEERCLLSFNPVVMYSSHNAQAVVAADFNNDAVLDLAVSPVDDANVFLGNGDGTFQPPQNNHGGAQSLAAGDFNGDGQLDLVATDGVLVSVMLGNGNGTFGAPTYIDIGSRAQSVAVGDFNGDGQLDLGVTSNEYIPPDGFGPGFEIGRANVLLGTGGGSFSAPIITSLWDGQYGGFHTNAIVADFNGDGKQDFAAVNYGIGTVAVALGRGDGTLALPDNFSVGNAPSALAAGDLNGDGVIDLVTANLSSGNVSVLLGNGLGSFGAAQNYATGSRPNSVALADFNGDGRIDLVTADSAAGTVSVLLGTGTGAFKPPVSVTADMDPLGVAVGDFNGDGRPDVASGSSKNLSVLLNDGNWPALDAPSITIDDVTVTEGNTGSVAATFTVNLSAVYGDTVSVHYATADSSATVAGGDYQATSADVVFAPGVTSQTVTVLVNGDRLAELNESFYVRLTNPTNAFVADATGVGVIVEDEPRVSISDATGGFEGNAGTTPFNFAVTLSNAYDVPVVVTYATLDGTATVAGGDYQPMTGTLTFDVGETSKTVTVLVNGDRILEYDEAFYVRLSNPINAFISDDTAWSWILNDEPFFYIDDYVSVMEGNTGTTPITFTVSLWDAWDVPVTVDYATSDLTDELIGYGNPPATAGVDYVATSGTLTFEVGQTSQTITVLVNGDRLGEGYEYFMLNLTNSEIDGNFALGEIADDEPVVIIGSATVVEGNSGTKTATFNVYLYDASDVPVSVVYATADGSATVADGDYQAQSDTLTFLPGETSKSITVLVNGDTFVEANETFFVNLSSPVGGFIGQGQGVGTIVNDDTDQPTLSITDVTNNEGHKGKTSFTFTVTLSAPSTDTVTVYFATADGTAKVSDSDYTAKSGTLTFKPGETTKTIIISVRGDRKAESDETFFVNLFSASGATIDDGQGIGTILNDDGETQALQSAFSDPDLIEEVQTGKRRH